MRKTEYDEIFCEIQDALSMVKNGEVMYKKSLRAAIDGQANARAKLTDRID